MSSRKRSGGPALGHDAFLDIVANLVGILIILVVILGASTAVKQTDAPEEPMVATDEQMNHLAESSLNAARIQLESDRLETMIRRYDNELAQAERARSQLMDLITAAKEAWASSQDQWDQKRVAAAARLTEKSKFEDRLAELEAQKESLESIPEKLIEIDHLPTPMAKTVFGQEVHLRLRENRVSVVPLDKLVDEIKSDFQRVAAGSKMGVEESSVGPIDGYIARYLSEKSRGVIRRDGRAAMATQLQLVRLAIEPLRETIGVPVSQTLTGRSDLDVELAGRDPATTTITVWVYPDSFTTFRELQKRLYQKGFATAARPLPMNMPITGSPQGSRSAAQ
ncbi:MAG: hypothetical protein AAF664_19040 [Planctomycetota bacterium]